MSKKNVQSIESADLRRRAEDRRKSKGSTTHPPGTAEDSLKLIHELEVHQIELELQNEELSQARKELEASLDRYTNLYDFAPVGYVTLDRNGTILTANLTGSDLLGVERCRLIGRRFGDFVSDNVRAAFTDFLERVFTNPAKVECEITLQREGNSELSLQIEGVSSSSKEECHLALIDISERKHAENALKELNATLEERIAERTAQLTSAKEEWERTFDSVPDLIAILDNQHRILRVNKAMARRLKCPPEKCVGLPCHEVVHGTSVPPEFCPHSKTILDDGEHVEELRMERFDGDFQITTTPLLDKRGECNGTVHIAHDITERKRMEDALRESEQRVRLKLESILTPEGDIGNLNLADIIDVKAIQPLMDDFFRLAHIPMSLSDLKGNVLVGVGWQEICTRFHRKHPETSRYCIESDTRLSAGIPEGEFRLYKCKNNMWEIVTPIMLGGKHLGNLFLGQFFFDDEQPDYELFRSQAALYGFNEADYMAALAEVPRWSREFVETAMTYFMKITSMISQVSYSNIKLARSLAERDALMESLRKSQQQNEFLANIVRHADQPFAQAYPDGRIGLINYAFEQLTGYTFNELVSVNWAKTLTPPKWQEFEREKLAELQRTGKPVRYEKEYIRKDGTCVPIELLVHIVTNSEENAYYYYSFITDITERKRDEEALKKLNEELEKRVAERTEELKFNNLILSTQNETSIDGILVVDESDTIISYNRRFVELWDIPPELVETGDDAPVLKLVASRVADREGFLARVKFLYNHCEEKSREEILLKDGRVFDRYSAPMMGDDGKYFGRVWYFRDITEHQIAEKTLREETIERLRAVEALREKEQLLIQQSRQAAMGEMIGNIAHQWRQPLNTLGLTIQGLLLFYDLNEFDREFLEKSVSSSMELIQHMSRTIDDFRNYFKPDKEKNEFKVAEAVENMLSLIRDSFISKHIDIKVVTKDDPVVHGYRNEFAQVLLNILNNARDALTERGTGYPKVKITIRSEGDKAVVTIADNAGGIPEEIIDKIFDPYFTTKGPQEGSGVGLFMSKAIIEKNMGGRLTAYNIANGAEFRIEI